MESSPDSSGTTLGQEHKDQTIGLGCEVKPFGEPLTGKHDVGPNRDDQGKRFDPGEGAKQDQFVPSVESMDANHLATLEGSDISSIQVKLEPGSSEGNAWPQSIGDKPSPLTHCSALPHLQCTICAAHFSGPSALNHHMETHSGEKLHGCKQCGLFFVDISSLQKHCSIHHSDPPSTQLCCVCSVAFSDQEALVKHMWIHTGKEHFKCQLCWDAFPTSDSLEHHKIKEHRTSEKVQNPRSTSIHTPVPPKSSVVTSKEAKAVAPSHYSRRTSTSVPIEKVSHFVIVPKKKKFKRKPKFALQCPVCSKVCCNKNSLRKHQTTHTREKPHKCEYCFREFARSDTLARHMRLHSGTRPYLCTVCAQQFVARNDLKDHLVTHSSDKDNGMNHNKEKGVTNTNQNVAGVIDSDLNGESPELSDKRGEAAHQAARLDERESPTHVKLSGEELKERLRLGNAKRKRKSRICFHCSKVCYDSASLRRHLRVHTGEKSYQCSYCPKVFARQDTLVGHERLHTGEKPFHCATCPATFTTRCLLRYHNQKHTGVRPHKCPECGRDFMSSSNLKIHMQTHTGEKPFLCTECGAAFACASSLSKHRHAHSNEKPFRCDLCPRKFAWPKSLKMHKLQHAGEKPFLCSQCPASFLRNGGLQSHMLIHSGEKPFPCSYCNKRFRSSGHLKTHEQVHTGVKPIKCRLCGAGFYDTGNLRKHMHTCHNDQNPYACSVCPATFNYVRDLTVHTDSHRDSQGGQDPSS